MVLEGLAFVSKAHIEEPPRPYHRLRKQSVRVERIVSSAEVTDTSWYQPERIVRLDDGTEIDSYSYAKRLADAGVYRTPSEDAIYLYPFTDRTGNTWYGVINGQHRVTAAKMDKAEEIIADIQQSDSGQAGYYAGIVLNPNIDK